MDIDRAQAQAVVATAQLAAAVPDTEFGIEIRPHGDRWTVQVSWDGGLPFAIVREVLEGPPPGVVLVHHARR